MVFVVFIGSNIPKIPVKGGLYYFLPLEGRQGGCKIFLLDIHGTNGNLKNISNVIFKHSDRKM